MNSKGQAHNFEVGVKTSLEIGPDSMCVTLTKNSIFFIGPEILPENEIKD